jgi:Spy/CpxP family protein refolding chaperone
MIRLIRAAAAGLAVVAIALLGRPAAAQQAVVGQAAGQTARYTITPSVAPAGYWELAQEHVQKELELLDEQKQQLKELAQKSARQRQQDWTGMRDLPPEERQKKYAEIREKMQKQNEEIRKQVEAILLPHQLKALQMIRLRTRGASALASPRIVEHLGLSEAQKEKIREARDELQKKMRELQRDAFEKTLKVLTPEQLEKLKELDAGGYRLQQPG